QIEWGILKEEAAKYYANIVMPYGNQVENALNSLSELDIDMIAPSHGIIWKSLIPNIIKEYSKWSRYETDNKALIIYDSMWGSTEKMAYSLREGIEDEGISVTMRNLKKTHISDILTDVISSKLILLGSPTLNNTMLPSMGGFLTYLKGLRPKKRVGYVFGSYGWGGQAVGEIEKILKDMSWDIPFENVNYNYIPNDDELLNVRKIGKKLGKYIKK
ncbi:MAG: FprA family A-type flavoprotein, partial [Thermoplasmatales archaeon]